MSLEEEIRSVIPAKVERAAAAVILGIMGVAFAVIGWFNPSTTSILPACPLLTLTGFACPGCGMTRGFHALLHGDFITALDFNALIPIYVLGFGYLIVSLVLTVIRGKGLGFKFATPTALFAFLFVSVGFGVIRNIPSEPFTVLFP